MATNQEKLDRIDQIAEAADVQINAKAGALQTLRNALNTAGPAGLIACQGDVNIILGRIQALQASVDALTAKVDPAAITTAVTNAVTAAVAAHPASATVDIPSIANAAAAASVAAVRAQFDK